MDSFTPITVSRTSTRDERQAALYQIYQQILERQPYAYERRSLAKAEKDFLSDKIGVRRFLKELGHSEVYLNSFYHTSTNLKFIESCFKHFLGRAPFNSEEVHDYCNVLLTEGVHHLITAILDSEEYRKFFGCFTVPHARHPRYYESPKAYLESDLLNHEYYAQRGRAIPTLYWHQLGLNCDGGVCIYIEDEELSVTQSLASSAPATATSPDASRLQDELLEILNALGADEAKALVSSLASGQKRPG
ncbi:MAG: phycobilisome rod-core linker polypeptide [Synechococcales cyanobacterium T60_A2020_003]|nr:phycobilisome rod-core linker polypeptide [Synechococcales cyanobacterium T60_A2020_003]